MGQITDYMTNVETKGLWLEPINDSTSIDASNVFFHIRQCLSITEARFASLRPQYFNSCWKFDH
jgi:hypothetical protein